MELKTYVKLEKRDITKQTGSRRIYLLRRTKYNFALCWLVLLSVTMSAAAEVSFMNQF
jgi:hypothetical protein